MAGITTIGAVTPEMGARANRELVRSVVALDTSGGAMADIVIFHTETAATLTKLSLLYTEASGAGDCTLTIGKETSAAYYYTGTTEQSKAKWYTKDVAMLQTDVALGDTVICAITGGSTVTGEIVVVAEFEYTE